MNQTTDTQPRDKAGARVVLWLLLGLVVLFGGLYVAAHYVAADKVPRNTTVAGVRIGGHPQDEAAERLRAGLADQVARDIATTVDGEQVAVDPARAGLSVDYRASVAEAGGEETGTRSASGTTSPAARPSTPRSRSTSPPTTRS